MFGFGLFLFLSAIAISIAIFVYRKEEARKREIKLFADQNGLEYVSLLPDGDYGRFKQFPIAAEGRSPQAFSGLIAEANGLRMVMFDYKYVRGHGKQRRTHHFGILMCSHRKLNLPDFSLEPESWSDRFSTFFGGQDIDFDEDPLFSKKFRLRGQPEDRIRAFFDAKRRSELMEHACDLIQANRDAFLLVLRSRHIQPNEVPHLMSQGLRYSELFLRDVI